jgi:hypothetical protein
MLPLTRSLILLQQQNGGTGETKLADSEPGCCYVGQACMALATVPGDLYGWLPIVNPWPFPI